MLDNGEEKHWAVWMGEGCTRCYDKGEKLRPEMGGNSQIGNISLQKSDIIERSA